MSQLSASEKLFGTTTLDERQAALARRTYALLGLSVVSAAYGGYLGATTPEIVRFFFSLPGFIAALVVINVIPRLALWASQRSAPVALAALALDGLVSGLVLAPILFFASHRNPMILTAAGGVTLAVFMAVTGYVMVARQRFAAPVGLMTGLTIGLLAAILLNMFLQVGFLGLLISFGVGALGVLMLIAATSDVLNDPDYNNPVQGALMLFAALFNIFVSLLNILLRLFGGSRD